MDDKLTKDRLIELIDCVKMYSGCDEVELIGSHKTFEEIIAMGFPLTDLKCEEPFEIDESLLYIIPVGQ